MSLTPLPVLRLQAECKRRNAVVEALRREHDHAERERQGQLAAREQALVAERAQREQLAHQLARAKVGQTLAVRGG